MTITISGNTSPVSLMQGGSVPQVSPLQKPPRSEITLPEPTSQQQEQQPKQLPQVVEAVKDIVERKAPNSLSFSIDEASGKTVVSISDAKTGELIRQIPSEEMLAIAKSLDELQGLLLRQAV